MVKSFITVIVSILLFIGGAIAEKTVVKNTFDELHREFGIFEDKLKEENATVEDALNIQQFWIERKEKLHIFIPHSEIKELDLWLAEMIIYVEIGDYDEARAKITVAKELVEQIPKTFGMRTENVL